MRNKFMLTAGAVALGSLALVGCEESATDDAIDGAQDGLNDLEDNMDNPD